MRNHYTGIFCYNDIKIGYDMYLFNSRRPKYVYIRGISHIDHGLGDSIYIDPFIEPKEQYYHSDVENICEAIYEFCEKKHNLFIHRPKLFINEDWMNMTQMLCDDGYDYFRFRWLCSEIHML